MKFRKRPVTIDALQLRWENWDAICDFVGNEFFAKGGHGVYVDTDGSVAVMPNGFPKVTETLGLIIPTLEGNMLAVQDDWIIRGVEGEYYPCKPQIFEKTYERVE